jgi:zinc transporter ZupT
LFLFLAGKLIYIADADLIPEIKHEESARLNILHFLSFLVAITLLLVVRFVFEG